MYPDFLANSSETFPQQPPTPEEPAHHRTHRATNHVRDFFVGKILQIRQQDHHAVFLGKIIQGSFHIIL